GKLLVQVANRIVRLNNNGSEDSSFHPISLMDDTVDSGYVPVIVNEPDGKFFVAAWNSVRIPMLRQFKSDGDEDDTFQQPIFQSSDSYRLGVNILNAAVQSDQKILISGAFDQVNGFARRGIVRFLPNGSVDGSWNLDLGPIECWTVASQTDELIVF